MKTLFRRSHRENNIEYVDDCNVPVARIFRTLDAHTNGLRFNVEVFHRDGIPSGFRTLDKAVKFLRNEVTYQGYELHASSGE